MSRHQASAGAQDLAVYCIAPTAAGRSVADLMGGRSGSSTGRPLRAGHTRPRMISIARVSPPIAAATAADKTGAALSTPILSRANRTRFYRARFHEPMPFDKRHWSISRAVVRPPCCPPPPTLDAYRILTFD